MNREKKVPNKRAYNWSFKEVPQKDLKNNLWPFKYVRDVGKSTVMECRSLSALNKSFEGTPYNKEGCDKAKSRYSAIFETLRDNYSKDISKITHMIITFNNVYFLIEGDSRIRNLCYSKNLCATSDLQKLCEGFFFENGIREKEVTYYTDMYKKTKNIEVNQALKNSIKNYIESRKNMIILDNTKFLYEIFTNSVLTFTSLKYLIFIPNIKIPALDYNKCIANNLDSSYLSNQKIINNLNKIPSLEMEVQMFKTFGNMLETNKVLKSIKKVYLVNNDIDINSETINNIFLKSNSASNEYETLFEAPLTIEERTKIDEKIAELQKIKGVDEEKIRKYQEEFQIEIARISNIVSRVSYLVSRGEHFFEIANVAEKAIWIDNLKKTLLKNKIQEEYDFKRKYDDTLDANFGDITSLMAFIELASNMSLEIPSNEKINLFLDILPTYLTDNRKTIKSLNLGFSKTEEAKNTSKEVKKLRIQMLKFLECFIGIQYGILCVYMNRFKLNGIGVAVSLMPSIRNKPMIYSKNILDIAERYFYSSLGASLNKDSELFYKSEKGKELLVGYNAFCKKFIDMVNNYDTEPLTHTGEGNEQIIWSKNLLTLLEHLEFLFEQYSVFFNNK